MLRTLVSAIALTALLSASAALAQSWTVEPSESTLAYEIAIGGSPAEGTFENWTANIMFDPAAPEEGVVDVVIEIGSVTISDARAIGSITAPTWLNVDDFPTAQFTAQEFDMTSETEFNLPGVLTLRGTSEPVTLTGTLVIDGDVATVSATGDLLRNTFQIGAGQDAVGQDVGIRIDLTAVRAD